MSEERDDQGRWIGGFLLGVILGALLMVGVGGGLWMARARQLQREVMEAHELAIQEEVEWRMWKAESDLSRVRCEIAEEQAALARQEAAKARQELECYKKGGK